MSISQELLDYQEVFNNTSVSPILFINDLSDISEEENDKVKKLVSAVYDSDVMSSVPACDCGPGRGLRGKLREKEICPECGFPCSPPLDSVIESILWFRQPRGVAPLINPTVFTMLSTYFTKSGWDIIRWLTDSSYKSIRKPIKEIDILLSMGVKRSYNWFVENFDQLMDTLFNMPGLKKKQSNHDYEKSQDLRELIQLNRGRLFSPYLPLPNRSLLIIEVTNVHKFVDNSMVDAINAINIVKSIDHELCMISQQQRENRTAKTIFGLADFYERYYGETVGDKFGLARRNMFGARAHFSIRSVATSITEPHMHDELHISWGSAVGVFKYHLLNKLMHKHDYTVNEGIGFLRRHAFKYNKLIDDLFNELISESKYGGIPCTHSRNPILMRGSIYLLRITRVKTNPEDPTASFSILNVGPPNADFDGDALHTMLTLDNFTAEGMADLAPYKSATNLKGLRELSPDLLQPKPVVATVSSWISQTPEEVATQEQMQFMLEMAA